MDFDTILTVIALGIMAMSGIGLLIIEWKDRS